MKRIAVSVLVLVLILGLSSIGWASTQIRDVDPSHWAYTSVKMLIDKGYLSLYEDSTFRGDRNVSRYQLAEVVAKILVQMEGGGTNVNQGDVNTIRQLTVEFRKELVDIVQTQNLFSSRLDQISRNQIVMKEDIARSQDQILDIIDQLILLKELDQRLKEARGDLNRLERQIAIIEKNMAEGLSLGFIGLSSELEDLKAINEINSLEIQSLQDENSYLRSEMKKLKDRQTQMIFAMIGGLILALLI